MYNKDLQAEIKEFVYRSRWVCFSCRKSFSRKRQNINIEVKCPDCRMLATDMGRFFKAPPKRNLRLWRIMELLGKNGFRYNHANSVFKINFLITGDNKLSPRMVEERISKLKK